MFAALTAVCMPPFEIISKSNDSATQSLNTTKRQTPMQDRMMHAVKLAGIAHLVERETWDGVSRYY